MITNDYERWINISPDTQSNSRSVLKSFKVSSRTLVYDNPGFVRLSLDAKPLQTFRKIQNDIKPACYLSTLVHLSVDFPECDRIHPKG